MKNDKKTSITPTENGPYKVEGLQNLANKKGAVDTEPTAYLCRCGGSGNKPFCDGTHWYNKFEDDKN